MTTIHERITTAETVLAAYNKAKGDAVNAADLPDDALDLITDLLHWLTYNGFDAEERIGVALMHHEAEIEEEGVIE